MSEIKTPPHDDDAERALLGAALLDIAALDEAIDQIDAGDFYRERHRHIWRAMCSLHECGVDTIDVITLGDELSNAGHLEAVGGASFLTRLLNEVPSAANVHQYIDILDRLSLRRKAIGTLGEYHETIRQGDDGVDESLNAVMADLYDLAADSDDGTMQTAREMAESAYVRLERMANDDGGDAITTGFLDVDTQLDGGLYDGNLIVLAGRPGMGKTSLALEMQRRQSVREGLSVFFASLEMGNDTVGVRHFSGLAGVALTSLRRGTLGKDGWSAMMKAAPKLKEARLTTDDEPAITPQKLRAKARRVRADHGGLDVVYVDYLQLMQAPGDHGTREREVAEISRTLKEIAKGLDVPVVALAQLNRSVERRDDKRPKLKDLRESGAIEQDADVVAFLYRESYYDEESNSPVAELIFRKNRNGPTGTVRLRWTASTTSFDDLDDRHGRGRHQ